MNIERDMRNSTRIFSFLIILFLSIKTTNGTVHTFPNRSILIRQFINRTIPTIYSWKKSNSIETLKRLIANRQHNRTLLLTSRFHSNIYIYIYPFFYLFQALLIEYHSVHLLLK